MNKNDFDSMLPEEQRKYILKSQKKVFKRITEDMGFIDRIQFRIIHRWINLKRVFRERPLLRLGALVIVSVLILYLINNAINYFYMGK